MYIVGIVLLFAGIALLLVRRTQSSKLRQIRAAQTSTVEDLVQLARSVRDDLRALGQAGDGLHQIAEVKGDIRSEQPLISEIAKQPCVYYSTSVVREYEETYWETDPETDQRSQRTRRGSETVSSNTQRSEFWVEDVTGRIKVDPTGAEIDSLQVVDRFEPAEAAQSGTTISLGSFRFNLVGPLNASGRRTLGYRFRESVLPLDRRVYVLGEAVDEAGELLIRKPHQRGKKFIVSLKSEEDLIRSAESSAKWLLYGATACGVIGVALVLVDFVI